MVISLLSNDRHGKKDCALTSFITLSFFVFIKIGRDDPSSSLGYGYFIIGFWIIAAIVLILLLIKKVIHPKSILEKIGIFTATPILSIAVVWLILSFRENASSESYFDKDNHRYKFITFHYKKLRTLKELSTIEVKMLQVEHG